MAPSTITSENTVKRRRRVYPNISRHIPSFHVAPRHPLNVKPSGNAFIELKHTEKTTKRAQMGDFSKFPEELLMDFFTFLSVPELKNLSHTSRVMYAYLYDEEIWKKQVKEVDQTRWDWHGSWRASVLGVPYESQANLQLEGNLVCSDVLYRPYQCSQVNYEKLFSKIIDEEQTYHRDALGGSFDAQAMPSNRIVRFAESEMSLADFNTKYHDIPFILCNNDETRWPKWTLDELSGRFSDVLFRQELMKWPLSLYAKYLRHNTDESPLYLFDCSSDAMKTLRNEFKVPDIFTPDFFKVFTTVQCRPDYAWLIMGPKRSGSTFHKDPNSTSAWNTAITGRKLWVMLPPGVTPPGVGTDDEESEVTSPVGIAEWVISGFFNDCLKIDECLIGITFPGECIHVPSGWWHSVINIDDSIALTQNFVPEPKLGNVLNFFKNKNGQISGFNPIQVKRALDEVKGSGSESGLLESDLKIIKEYSVQFDTLNLQNLQEEDCGEIDTSKLPPMPIYELFRVLMVLNGQKDVLDKGLEQLAKIEKSDLFAATGKSETWTKLLEESTGFAFGFDSDSE